MKKKVSLLTVGLLLMIQVLQSLIFITDASAKEVTESIITDVALTATDGEGNPVKEPVIEPGASVQLDFQWELANGHDYVSGDTYTFDLLPENKFVLFNDISGELIIDGSDSVGTFVVNKDTRKITITFNEFISSHDQIKGTITLNTKFDKQKITGSTEQVINFPIRGGQEKSITVHFKPAVDSTIAKTGAPDQPINAKNIKWSVDVNKKLENVKHATVTDPTPEGLKLDSDSFKVYHLGVNIDGSTTLGSPVDPSEYTVGNTEDGKGFELKFNAETINSAYRIEYLTQIESGTSFKNTATFSGVETGPNTASATVEVTSGNMLKKSVAGYDPQTQTIKWKIQYNYGGQAIPKSDAKLTDLFNDNQELVDDIKVYKVTPDANGQEVKGDEVKDFDVTDIPAVDGKRGFELQFKSDVNSPYLIEYETKPTNLIMDKEEIKNTVTTATYEDTASQWIEQEIGNKSVQSSDYVNKTITWRITVNPNKLQMSNVIIKDTFTNGGLELIDNSLKVVGEDQKELDSSEYEVKPLDQGDGFEFKFKNPINTSYTLTYDTKYNLDSFDKDFRIPNQALISWTDSNTSKDYSKETNTSFNPRQEVKNNGFKYGSYDTQTKEITWTIGVNYNSKELNKATVEDQLDKIQKYIPDSVRVNEMIIDKNGNTSAGDIVAAGDYSLSYDPATNKLVISFKKPINKPYLIVFKTSVENNLLEKLAHNTAALFNDGTKESADLKASVNIPHGGEYISKSGEQDGELLHWNIILNQGQSYVKNAKIIDTPSPNQILVPESFHLFETLVGKDGSVSKGNELVSGKDYQITQGKNADGQAIFTLTFTKEISKPYILQYDSLINAKDGDKVTNKVSFEGENTRVVTQETSEEVIVGVSGGSGTGTGTRGELTVIKFDKDHPETLLKGAKFSLERKKPDGSIIPIATVTTDQDGKAVFTKLLSGQYILKEVGAPEGYDIDATVHSLTISASNPIQVIKIANKKTVTPTPGPTPGNGGTPPTNPTPTNPTPSNPTPTPTPTNPTPTNPTPTPGSTPVEPTPAPAPEPTQPAPVPKPEPVPAPPVPAPGSEVAPPAKPTPQPSPKGEVTAAPGKENPQVLPKTGESDHRAIQMTGLSLILLGLLGAAFSRKKWSTSKK